MAKLTIHGLLEVEGSEEFVYRIYEDYKESGKTFPKVASQSVAQQPVQDNKKPKPSAEKAVQPKPKSSKQTSGGSSSKSFDVVKDLFSGPKSKQFLEEIKKYSIPSGSHQKKVTLFIYVLGKIGVEKISLNHVFTCYRLLAEPTPKRLRQTIIDAKNKNVWVINDNWDDLRTHHKGDELVEYELIKKNEVKEG